MSDNIELGGWDIAFAMQYGDVNKSIADMVKTQRADAKKKNTAAAFPKKLDYTDPVLGSTTVKADIPDPWRFKSGGDGAEIVLGVTMTNLSIQVTSPIDGKVILDISGATAIVDIFAKIAGNADGTFQIVPRQSARIMNVNYQFQAGSPALDTINKVTVDTAINEWVKNAMPGLGIILSKIDTSLGTKNPDWDWLIPKVSEALVSEVAGRSDDEQLLVIRSMTTSKNAPVSGLTSGKLVPDGNLVNGETTVREENRPTLGIAINPSLFLEKLIQPALYTLFDGAKPADFRVVGKKIVTTKTWTIKNFAPDEKKPTDVVPADFSNFAVEIVDDHLDFSSGIKFDYLSVVLSTTYRSLMALSYGDVEIPMAGGKPAQTIKGLVPTNTLVAANDTRVSASASLDLGSYITGAAVIIAGAIFSAASAAAGDDDPPAPGAKTSAGGNNVQALGDIEDDNAIGLRPTGQDETEAAATLEDSANGKSPKRTFSHTRKYWFKTIGVGMLSLLLGGGLTTIPSILQRVQSGFAKDVDEDLDDFMLAALKVLLLPSGPASDYKILNAQINGTLVIGAKLKTS